jgi:hypothetical protein
MNYLDICPIGFNPGDCSDDFIEQYVRGWRNLQLDLSDWTQMSDVDLTNKWDWAVYRQQLRDLPEQGNDPKLWVLPVSPT